MLLQCRTYMEKTDYDSDDYGEEQLDIELIDVTVEEDFKPKWMDRYKDAVLNILSDEEDNEVEYDEHNGNKYVENGTTNDGSTNNDNTNEEVDCNILFRDNLNLEARVVIDM